jgi:hypothetical protein
MRSQAPPPVATKAPASQEEDWTEKEESRGRVRRGVTEYVRTYVFDTQTNTSENVYTYFVRINVHTVYLI